VTPLDPEVNDAPLDPVIAALMQIAAALVAGGVALWIIKNALWLLFGLPL
jgi:hypothetical protein